MPILNNPIAGTVQYAYPGDIESLCHDIVDGPFGDNYMMNLAHLVREENPACTNASYKSFIRMLSNPEPNAETASLRSWFYQCCTE
ncbi:peptidase S28, partial [Kipferlia bialata]|eukprot:g13241.t1